MKLIRRKSTWDRLREPVAARVPGRTTVVSGLLAAGAAAGLTALSSAVSSYRKKKQHS